ncbi:hypothetical protein N473_04555 [Pseudoalteromonas luteoviolacea CPMOR-1]|uniref:Uncharacterized protein n=1 Tax=Pseudoalteromonas luteoviolacea CPMOR-1 TaxID=1365248 RepID=A0A167HZL4_9GAMM|nr:hypothetical protein [Pseudoalteromonas luteoviolacea]KZN58710.1 hypothetical protein N473_04555 [Pseudoalteromonas luteoviolacea CPMOR-1]
MLEAFSIKSIYHAINFISFPVMLIALLVSWKSINTRCLLLILATIELIDTITAEIAFHWGSYYYLWAFLNCWVYAYAVFGRRSIVKRFQKYSQFCKDVYENFYFTKQEGALLFIYFSYMIVTFIALIELSFFYLDLIGSVPYLRHAFSPLLTFFCLLESIVILWLATRTVPIDEHVLAIKHARKMQKNNHFNKRE